MNRLMVIHYPFFGGPHNQALRLDEPLRRRGIRTHVLLPAEPGNAAARLIEGGVAVEVAPLHRLRSRLAPKFHIQLIAGFVRDVQTIRRIIRTRAIDVVEVNGLVNPQAAVAARLERTPVVWQILDTRTPPLLRRLLMPVVRRLATVVMTTGMEVARTHDGVLDFGDRFVPFVPPVATETFRPDANARVAAREELRCARFDVVVGCVANITPQKGLEHFIDVAHRVTEQRPNVGFVLLGRPMETQQNYLKRIRSLAAPLVEAGSLVIRDPGSRVQELLRAFDVFLVTPVPRSEGISTTVLEAMATALPIVTTAVGSIPEVMEDGREGFVVPAMQTCGLVDAVLRLVDNARLRVSMGEAARRRAVSAFDSDACAAEHARAFDLATSRKR